MSQVHKLMDRLANACRTEVQAAELLASLSAQLDEAKVVALKARQAVHDAENAILLEAKHCVIGKGFEECIAHERGAAGQASGLAIKVEMPAAQDPAVQAVADSIVESVCDALVKRLQQHAGGARTEPT